MTSEPETFDGLLRKLHDKRRRIAAFVHKYEPRGARLTNLGIVCGAIATTLTAAPAIGGLKLADALGSAGPNSPSWRVLCGAAALFSLVATIATNLFKSHDIASRLARAQACDAKLEGLEVLAELKQLSLKEATARYEKCLPDVSFISPEEKPKRWFQGTRRLDGVEGSIKEPNPNQIVDDPFLCSGRAAGLESGLYLWLAVEIDGRLWPKEGEVSVRDDGSWSKTIFEEGAADEFSLSLWAVNAKGDRHVRDWFKECDRTGNYRELRRTSGMQRLARVSGLRRGLARQRQNGGAGQ
jgi:hypothetical protein